MDPRSAGATIRRWPRLAVAFVSANRRHLLRNAVAILAWAALLVVAFDRLGWPRWLFDGLLVGGIVVYTLTQPPFEVPEGG